MFPSSLSKSERVGVVSVVNKYIIWFKRKNSFFGKHFCCLSEGRGEGVANIHQKILVLLQMLPPKKVHSSKRSDLIFISHFQKKKTLSKGIDYKGPPVYIEL